MILAWIVAGPVVIGVLTAGMRILFERTDHGVPRWFVVWMTLCVIVLSPFRYIVLQLVVASAYPVQSVQAFISVFPLALYVPIVFGLLYAVGVGLPLYVTLRVAFGSASKQAPSTGQLIIGSAIAPLSSLAGYFAFFWLLHFAAFTVHWLRADDVIGATNGPARVTYSVFGFLMPLPVKGYYTEVSNTDRETLRNHVASYYLGWKGEARYVRLSYPALYQRLTSESEGER